MAQPRQWKGSVRRKEERGEERVRCAAAAATWEMRLMGFVFD